MKPIVAVYSTFLKRAYDQIYHDVCLQRLPVTFAMDRAGFAGDDGRTHHGLYDLSYLRCLPNMTVMAPKDENELRHMLATATSWQEGPVAVRYPRGSGVGVDTSEPLHQLPYGRAEVIRDGGDLAILAVGSMVLVAERAAAMLRTQGVEATVVNARFIKPLDEALILSLADSCGALITVEENTEVGGFGTGVLEVLARNERFVPAHVVAVPDRVYQQASQDRLREMAGLTPEAITEHALELLEIRGTQSVQRAVESVESGAGQPAARP